MVLIYYHLLKVYQNVNFCKNTTITSKCHKFFILIPIFTKFYSCNLNGINTYSLSQNHKILAYYKRMKMPLVMNWLIRSHLSLPNLLFFTKSNILNQKPSFLNQSKQIKYTTTRFTRLP